MTPGTGSSGVYIREKSGVTVKNLNIKGFSYGIRLYGSNHINMLNNNISSSTSGIYNEYLCWYCMSWCSGRSGHNSIVGNNISASTKGVDFGNSCSNTFEGNTFTGNNWAAWLYSETWNTFKNNVLSNNGDGLFMWSGSIGNTVSDNTFTGHTNRAIEVYSYSNSGLITGNKITGNATGIAFIYNSGAEVTGNTIASNQTGAIISDQSTPNFQHNNFVENSAQISQSSPKFNSNYWSIFDSAAKGCLDLNLDGFCDSAFSMLGIFDQAPWAYQDGWAKKPLANAGPDQVITYDLDLQGGAATLDGSRSTDPNGDQLTYSWNWPGGRATGAAPTTVLPLGTTVVTLSVGDGSGIYATDTVKESVRYGFCGFTGAVSLGKYFKRQRGTIPVEFKLNDAKGRSITNAVAKLTLEYSYIGPSQNWYMSAPIEPTSNVPDSGDLFRYEGDRYIYNLSTDALAASSSWLLNVELNDGSTYNTWIHFEK